MADKERGKGKTATGNLVSIGDVAKMANTSSNTVSKWIERDLGFPKPASGTTASRLYSKGAVVRWLRSTGRMK